MTTVAAIVEFLYRDYKTPVDYIMLNFNKNKENIKAIITGNSHTDAIGTPDIFEDINSTINLSMGGQDLYHILLLLEKCIPESPRLKLVILGLDYDMAGYNFAKEKQEWKDRYYYPWNKNIYDRSFGNIIMAESGFMRSNRDLSYLFSSQEANQNPSFIPPVAAGNNEHVCRKRALEHSVIKFSRDLAEENLYYLKRISEICKNHNVTLLFVNTPKSTCYTNNYHPEVIKFSSQKYKTFSLQHNIVYLDLFSDTCFTENDFIDFDHLNKQGVDKLLSRIRVVLNINNANDKAVYNKE